MGLKTKFEERIKRKELEIVEYETKIREARAYLQALQWKQGLQIMFGVWKK